jgi:predicted nucleotidyltransferase
VTDREALVSDTQDTPTLEGLRARRDEILKVAELRGARNVRVFGSVARGEASVDSDIDLLVDMEPDRTALDLSELILDLEETLGRRVDVVEIRRPSPSTDPILREAVAL